MRPKLSVVIPMHWMKNWSYFLNRALASIEAQSFTDYEVIVTKHGKMAENTNFAITSAKGELVKILYMDDYLAHTDSLKVIVESFSAKDTWLVTGCLHQGADGFKRNPHFPRYTEDIHRGNNCIGSPSVVTLRRDECLLFDEELSYLLDCDLYKRYYDLHGEPRILNNLNVVVGLHFGQTSNLMSLEEKQKEFLYTDEKYV